MSTGLFRLRQQRFPSLALPPRWGLFLPPREPGLTPGPIVCRASGAGGGPLRDERHNRVAVGIGWGR